MISARPVLFAAALGSAAILAPRTEAQERAYYVYYCHGGKAVRTKRPFVRSEMVVSFNLDAPVPPRPDYGRFVFVKDLLSGNKTLPSASWARTSTMARACKEEQACTTPATGRAVATVAGPATAGGSEDSAAECAPERSIQTARCAPDGTLQTQTITGTSAQLKRFTGADISNDAEGILYWPTATGAAAEWRQTSLEALRRECAEPKSEAGLFRDGKWRINITNDEMSDCPAAAVAMVKSSVPLAQTTRDVIWSTPPNPRDLLPETAALAPWQGADRSWRLSYAPPSNAQADVPIKVDVDYTFQGRTDHEINILGQVQIRAAGALAQMAGFNGNCVYTMNAVATHVAP